MAPEESVDDIYGGNYLKISDIPHNGVLECKIKTAFVDLVGKDKPTKKIILDLESGKSFPLNKINSERLAKNFGSPKFATWVGKSFKVKQGETQFNGKDTPCIRVVKEYED
jgi:hypothetical protein